jgi:hypothetical protein
VDRRRSVSARFGASMRQAVAPRGRRVHRRSGRALSTHGYPGEPAGSLEWCRAHWVRVWLRIACSCHLPHNVLRRALHPQWRRGVAQPQKQFSCQRIRTLGAAARTARGAVRDVRGIPRRSAVAFGAGRRSMPTVGRVALERHRAPSKRDGPKPRWRAAPGRDCVRVGDAQNSN